MQTSAANPKLFSVSVAELSNRNTPAKPCGFDMLIQILWSFKSFGPQFGVGTFAAIFPKFKSIFFHFSPFIGNVPKDLLKLSPNTSTLDPPDPTTSADPTDTRNTIQTQTQIYKKRKAPMHHTFFSFCCD